MKNLSRLFFLIVLYLLSANVNSFAQGLTFYINGKITDRESGEPIHLAEMFISGSSVGTATDEEGKFSIIVPYLPCYLVITHETHDPFATYIENFMDSVHVTLNPNSINPDDYLKLNNNERRKEVRFFYQQFIGDDLHTSYDILNEAVLYFKRDEYNFQATSNLPLVIINNYLGYKIRILIREFDITKRDDLTHDEVPLNSYSGIYVRRIMGHYYYEPIEHGSASQLRRYEKNRQNFYYGSYRHFLKALYDGQIMEQGYQLTFYPPEAIRTGISFTNLSSVKHSPSRIKECVMDADSLKVDYYSDANGYPINLTKSFESFNKETSVIFPNRIPVRIRPNGTTPNIPFDIRGPMGEYYFINTLPDDYEPKREEN